MFKLIFVFMFYFAFTQALQIPSKGNSCKKDGIDGVCSNLKICSSALSDLENGRNVQLCQTNSNEKIVCCTDHAANRTKRYASQDRDESCDPLPTSVSPANTGRKAFDKCVEYQQKLVYPCVDSVLPGGKKSRGNNCGHEDLVVGGNQANPGEFPHMALLGYSDEDKINWRCSGSVISEKFILTVAHCVNPRLGGLVSHVLVGTVNRADKNEENIYKVKGRHVHPEYAPPAVYNDIALLETEKEIVFNNHVIPACLPVDIGTVEKAKVSSWLRILGEGKINDNLHKLNMVKFDDANCSASYNTTRLLKNGVNLKSQLCFGHVEGHLEACQTLSGAPLQVENEKISCMYTLVGVASLGRQCHSSFPDLYSNVKYFLPWIERIVFL